MQLGSISAKSLSTYLKISISLSALLKYGLNLHFCKLLFLNKGHLRFQLTAWGGGRLVTSIKDGFSILGWRGQRML